MKTLPCHLLIAAVLAAVFSSPSAHAAATVAVGTCHASTPSYPTIQQAVNAVSSGGTVLVCAGVYAEQITISQPMTLKSIAVGKQQIAAIYTPASGLAVNYVSPNLNNVTAHIFVQNAGAVTISNIEIDGLGTACPNTNSEVGISSLGSSLTVNAAVVRNISAALALCSGASIFSEGGGNLTVQNSTLRGFDSAIATYGGGIGVVSGNLFSDGATAIVFTSPTAPVSVSTNTLANINDGIGLNYALPGSSVVNNVIGITPAGTGIPRAGISLIGTANITGNKMSGGGYGLRLDDAAKSTVQNNVVTDASVGLRLNDGGPGSGSNVITKNTFKFTNCGLYTVAAIGDTVNPNTYIGNRFSTCP